MEKLAINGGKPARAIPLPERNSFGEKEKNAAIRVLDRVVSSGKGLDRYGGVETDAYEKEFAAYFGTKFATAVSSGTASIHSAVAALNLEPGSEIITAPITDNGTIMPMIFQQCIPILADVDYKTLNMSPESIEKKITKRTKAIVVVHLAGMPADMDRIMKIARKHKLYVIEDCAQAHGAVYKKKFVGSIGDMGCFSMMGSKHTTSGGQGGMVITSNENLYWAAKRFADRGKPFGTKETSCIRAGLNYRMTDLEAAIGREQLKRLDNIRKKRCAVYMELKELFKKNLSAFRMWENLPGTEPNPWFCFIHIDRQKIKEDNSVVSAALRAEGMFVGAHYTTPMTQSKWLAERNTLGKSQLPWTLPGAGKIKYEGTCPNAEKALIDHLTFYMNENWKKREVRDALKAFQKVEAYYMKK
ncbi:MAG TPA: DegT/DnrJ/EryC1/StrS family aminotransferase [bacterium]|nr:DegT/DnrJ/EryC1/StrS family aminotransferase [bacterium]